MNQAQQAESTDEGIDMAFRHRAKAYPAGSPERLYTVHYLVDAGGLSGHHQYLYEHPNGLFILGLAPEHVAIQACSGHPSQADDDDDTLPNGEGGGGGGGGGVQVTQIEFLNDASDQSGHGNVSGKRKRGALQVKADHVLAKIHLSNGNVYDVYSGVGGQLLEINENLKEHPEYLITKPHGLGFLAIIQPLRNSVPDRRQFIASAQYKEKISGKKTSR